MNELLLHLWWSFLEILSIWWLLYQIVFVCIKWSPKVVTIARGRTLSWTRVVPVNTARELGQHIKIMVNCNFFSSCNSCDVMNIQRESWIAHYWVSVLSFIEIVSLSSIAKILSVEITYICIVLDWRCLHLILSNNASISHLRVSNICLVFKILSRLIFPIVISACPELIIFLYLIHILLKLFVLSLIKHLILISQIAFPPLIWFSDLRCVLAWLNLFKSNHCLSCKWIGSSPCIVCNIL